MAQEVKKYTTEFKQNALNLVQTGKSIGEVAEQLGVSRATLNRWISDAVSTVTTSSTVPESVVAQAVPLPEPTKEIIPEPIIAKKIEVVTDMPSMDWVKVNAEAIVKEAFIGLLERQVDQSGLEAFSNLLRHDPRVSQILIRLIKSKEFVARLFSENFQKKVSEATKKLLLNLGGMSVEAHTEVTANKELNQIIISLLGQVSPEIENHFAYLNQNTSIAFQHSQFSRLFAARNFGLVFVADEMWLPFALVTADFLRNHYKLETILVYKDWSPGITAAQELSASVFEIISLRELKQLPENSAFQPQILVSHSYGWKTETKDLLAQFPKAVFLVYADGFKNEVTIDLSQQRTIGGAVFFGYIPANQPLNAITTVNAKEVIQKNRSISALYKFTPKFSDDSFKNYAVVYLRYFGSGVYKFSFEEIIQCFADTTSRYVATNTTLVIKNDKRADPLLFPRICKVLAERGYPVIGFDDYLVQHGVDKAYQFLPVEYFLARGLLCQAVSHVVFDSSLSYIIAIHPNIKVQTDIILGVDVRVFKDKLETENSQENIENQLCNTYLGLETIRHFLVRYCEAILNSDNPTQNQLVERDGNFLFRIRKMAS
jgi:transposase-like protein